MFTKRYVDNPDTFGIKEVPSHPLNREIREVHDETDCNVTFTTNREAIAALIRKLTYRELKQIAQEIVTCANTPDIGRPFENVAQTLDDWAHMVKDKQEGVVDWDDINAAGKIYGDVNE